jgi:hypothetical protein
VKPGVVDVEKVRFALRRMSRGDLLTIAERAIEMVPRTRLGALVGDMVRHDQLVEQKGGAASLLDEVRKFHDASLRGDYYDSFDVNSKNFMDRSGGTEEFTAEFDWLIGKCVLAAARGSHPALRETFELLFALLRSIDEDPDSVVFFADEAGSWQVGVDWREVLPAYFRCLARWHASRGLRARGRRGHRGLRQPRAASPPRRRPARRERRAEGCTSTLARAQKTPVIPDARMSVGCPGTR